MTYQRKPKITVLRKSDLLLPAQDAHPDDLVRSEGDLVPGVNNLQWNWIILDPKIGVVSRK